MYSQSYHNNQFPNTFIVPKRHPAPSTGDAAFPKAPSPRQLSFCLCGLASSGGFTSVESHSVASASG